MPRRLETKVALVTGGARGVGEAIVRRFASEGARVAVCDRRDDEGHAVAATLGDAARYWRLDVASESDWADVVGQVIATWGGVDVLVNNAGVNRVTPIAECTLETFMRIIETNLVGCFLGMRAVRPTMCERGRGSIINVSSPQGFEGRGGMAPYTASKFGIRGLTKTAAIEFGPSGVRVNALVPGPVKTAMTNRPGWTDADYERAYGGYPIGRRADVEEIAAAALFLASDESSFCTGADLVVDGGVLAGKPST